MDELWIEIGETEKKEQNYQHLLFLNHIKVEISRDIARLVRDLSLSLKSLYLKFITKMDI